MTELASLSFYCSQQAGYRLAMRVVASIVRRLRPSAHVRDSGFQKLSNEKRLVASI